jgi:nucleotide-binding universal stress UspA family protein
MHGAKIVVLHCLEVLPLSSKALVEPYIDQKILRRLSETKYSFAKETIVERIEQLCRKELQNDPDARDIFETIELVEGYPSDEILKKTNELNCDAIIMGTHGKGFMKHSYFGSTCSKVLRRIHKPVFIIPLPEGEIDVTFHDR